MPSPTQISASTFHIVADNSTVGSHCEQGGSGGNVGVGIAMGVVGSVLINIGQNLQATALQSSPSVQAEPCTSRTWRIGMGTFVCGALLNFVAFTFASASVLVPIEAIQFVVNVAYSKYVNRKPVSTRMLCGVSLTILGTLLCVIFGSTDTRCFTLTELESLWSQPFWWVWLICSLSAALGAYAVHRAHSRALAAGHPKPNHEVVLPVTYALSSALLGGANMIVHSKAVAELVELQVQGVANIWAGWYFYLELTLLVTMGVFWLYRMNESLGLFDPLFIIPLLQSSYILFGAIAGGIYFQEFAGLHNGPAGAVGWPLFIMGMLGVLAGLRLIAPQASERVHSTRVDQSTPSGNEQPVHLTIHGEKPAAPAASRRSSDDGRPHASRRCGRGEPMPAEIAVEFTSPSGLRDGACGPCVVDGGGSHESRGVDTSERPTDIDIRATYEDTTPAKLGMGGRRGLGIKMDLVRGGPREERTPLTPRGEGTSDGPIY